jgi:hypothetical protein
MRIEREERQRERERGRERDWAVAVRSLRRS